MYHKPVVRKKRKCLNCGYWNLPEAAYCNLCYEPFRKPGQSRPARPAKKDGQAAPRVLAAVALVLAAGTIGLILFPLRHPTPQERPAFLSSNRFAEKSAAADKLLEDYIAAKKVLLAGISEGQADPAGFGLDGEYTRKLFSIEEDYARKTEALDLPEGAEVDAGRDAAYLEWLGAHRARETGFMEEFSLKYQRLLERAASGYLPPQ